MESEIERQKALEKKIDCKFKNIFNIFNEINRIHDYIVKSREKLSLEKICDRLLNLEFKSNHSIKIKCLKWIVKNFFPEFNN